MAGVLRVMPTTGYDVVGFTELHKLYLPGVYEIHGEATSGAG